MRTFQTWFTKPQAMPEQMCYNESKKEKRMLSVHAYRSNDQDEHIAACHCAYVRLQFYDDVRPQNPKRADSLSVEDGCFFLVAGDFCDDCNRCVCVRRRLWWNNLP
jgi:hypothetical protein